MKHYIGVDVAKAQLDVDWLGEAKSYNNETVSIEIFINKLKELQKQELLALVICEATGGYEKKLVLACHEAELPVHVAHANKVRYFAKSKGLKAKTDKIDARVLSDYGRLMQPLADHLLLNKSTEKIAELLKRREQLQADKKREVNRSDKLSSEDIIGSVNDHIEWLDKNIKKIDKKLSLLKKTEEVQLEHELLTSIPSIGDLSAYYILSSLPEIGKVSNNVLAALVGVAPYNHDSGQGQGKRYIQGGRSHLRQVLYMAAITAIRHNPPLRSFYTRLREKGKATKVAIIAVIRKLITMANSVMKRGTPWEEECPKYC